MAQNAGYSPLGTVYKLAFEVMETLDLGPLPLAKWQGQLPHKH
jgi:hypothetical protein